MLAKFGRGFRNTPCEKKRLVVLKREGSKIVKEGGKRPMEPKITVTDPFKLCSVGTVKRLLLEHKIRPSKAMGQSFIVNKSALEKIVNAAGLKPNDGAFEVGTGLGALTAALAQKSQVVISVEKDRRLFSVAQSLLSSAQNVILVCDDALTANWRKMLEEHKQVKVWKFVSNLPYSVSKPLLMRLMRERRLFESAVVTVQREVAQRMVAKPNGEGYSILSIAIQFYADARILFNLPPTSFHPEPEVWSSVVKLEFLPKPRVEVSDESWFFKVAEAVLMQRRKTVVNALHIRFSLPKGLLKDLLQMCGIDPERRGETLTLKELALLAENLRQSLNPQQ
ncbi:MAG: 16S rRNA (adenine(1518)-N(6)/adenine(1519)-N(6))-dimethyltransferase RsmA [Armatimonadetes bacterium]|nr:16S rRNA (adenine(1518)-N(6)/adenine(1519)-N(6))-dimethyltransferase RsmA [Armatimonadota bacterium]MCX7966958.1 16S rRNA (adenine(1518)-N(6)/adenine(1519)-N(6))-dimethyltransferase RsmA [Armatimonadota bacterium]MDW8142959.1 16S rRNA (adenine(1518)-N(6)/adenine(1519)-N(6))-dimethyltransferase RsmA [Armatimonadota bacterium]